MDSGQWTVDILARGWEKVEGKEEEDGQECVED
jgi:hypothetical protein